MSEIIKSEYNALDEQGNYKTHYFKTSADQVVGLANVATSGNYDDLSNKPIIPVKSVNGKTGDVVVDTLPVGTSIMYSGDTVPDGYLAENGAGVSRTTYAKLFAAIGTKYGVGNGSTTFNLPNRNNGSFPEGSDTAGTVKSAGLPNITGTAQEFRPPNGIPHTYTGAFYDVGTPTGKYDQANSSGNVSLAFGIDASRSSAIYGKSTTVQPKSVTVKFCIKY